MKLLRICSFATLLAIAALPSVSFGSVIFNDTFDSGTGGWYRAGTSGILGNSSQKLSWAEDGSGMHEVIGRPFAPTTVAVGETLRLTYTFTTTSTLPTIIRVGLYDFANTISAPGWATGSASIGGSYDGYNSFLRVNNSTEGNAARSDTGTILDNDAGKGPLQAGTNYSTNTSPYNLAASTAYVLTYEITRTAENSITTVFTLGDGSSVLQQVGGAYDSASSFIFDTVTLRNTSGTLLYDDINLEVIPEPSTLALAAVALSGIAMRRRREI